MLFSYAALRDYNVLHENDKNIYTYVFMTSAFFIQFLGCIPKNMSAMRYSTLVTALIVSYVSIVIICDYVTLRPFYQHTRSPIFKDFDMNMSLFTSYCFSLFSVVNQFSVVNVISELKKPSTRRLNKVIVRSAIFPIIIYLCVGVLGYLTYGSACPDIIIQRKPDPNSYDIMMNLGRLCIFFGI